MKKTGEIEETEEETYEIERDLSLQVPVFVEENLDTKDFDLKDKSIWIIGDEKETVNKISDYF